MNIVIDSAESLTQFTKKTARFTKIPASKLKSAIALGQGYMHISALNKALTPAPFVNSDKPEILALRLWLMDNMDGGSDIHFDNEGKIDSEAVYDALFPSSNTNTTEEPVSEELNSDEDNLQQRFVPLKDDEILDDIMRINGLSTPEGVNMDVFEMAEDAITENVSQIGQMPSEDISEACALLASNGKTTLAHYLLQLANSGKHYRYLKDNT
jgi:hypothetical protein